MLLGLLQQQLRSDSLVPSREEYAVLDDVLRYTSLCCLAYCRSSLDRTRRSHSREEYAVLVGVLRYISRCCSAYRRSSLDRTRWSLGQL